ncbi:hypothetical protein QJ054_32965 [Streptomyces sp. AN-3]|uniref:Uncharacterized protein n=1 Tax=Streptomyces rochei TaxID=1928 RepID=A0ABW7E8C7_STRRO|nr:hypothetical protein [Streptomyces sp. AN-3]MDI3101857.1 hypothetical protein [Streptomyces sp. AN-3]
MADEPEETPQLDVPVGMFEDIEDLKAQVASLTALVKTLTGGAGDEPGKASTDRAEAAGGEAAESEANEE